MVGNNLLFFVVSVYIVNVCNGDQLRKATADVVVSDDYADVGKWSIGNCILAEFAMEFQIFLDKGNQSNVQKITVPSSATANKDQSNCQPEKDVMSLSWQETPKNDTSSRLWRNVTVVFAKKNNESYYGVERFYAVFQMAHFVYNGTNATSRVTIDSGDRRQLMLLTPIDRSFLCANIDTVPLNTTFTSVDPLPKVLNNTLLSATHVHFDAFRPADKVPTTFRTPMDCDYHPNDIIPIAVGVALAALVVAVLIAYMVGRRRHMQRGYQSV